MSILKASESTNLNSSGFSSPSHLKIWCVAK